MFKKLVTLGLAGLLNFNPVNADRLDDFIGNFYVDGKGDEWRDHFWGSLFLTVNDSFLLRHAGCKDKPEDLAAKVRFLETVGYQGYTMLYEKKITPVYSAFDILGAHLGHKLFPRLEFLQPVVDELADITEKDKLRNLALLTAGTVAVGYTLPSRRDLIKLDLDEQIEKNNRAKHIIFFSYYTFRTSWLLEHAGYDKHPPESLAWRIAFGMALGKELIVDSLIGKGPSVGDALENGVGVASGYWLFKVKDRINLNIYDRSVKLNLKF